MEIKTLRINMLWGVMTTISIMILLSFFDYIPKDSKSIICIITFFGTTIIFNQKYGE